MRLPPLALTLTFAACAASSACSRPAPPTLVPERVRLTGLTTARIDLEVALMVQNPNDIDLVARNLTAHFKVADKFELGTADLPVTTVFPAHQSKELTLPLTVKVQDLALLITMAATSSTIPFTVDGTVGLGGELLHVDLPYQLDGTVSRDQILRATVSSLPPIPGFPH